MFLVKRSEKKHWKYRSFKYPKGYLKSSRFLEENYKFSSINDKIKEKKLEEQKEQEKQKEQEQEQLKQKSLIAKNNYVNQRKNTLLTQLNDHRFSEEKRIFRHYIERIFRFIRRLIWYKLNINHFIVFYLMINIKYKI